MKIEYLTFNFLIIGSIIMAKIFYKKSEKFNQESLCYSIFIPAIIFIIIDHFATGLFWDFNDKYILGLKLFKLPLEEILFFITVPVACLFLWVNYKTVTKINKYKICFNCLMNLLLLPLVIFFWYQKLYYSFSMLILLMSVIAVDKIIKTELFRQKRFLIYLGILNLFTFIFNLYLTARSVVIYSPVYKTNVNIITIPIEDFIFGISLVSLNIIIYEYLVKKL